MILLIWDVFALPQTSAKRSVCVCVFAFWQRAYTHALRPTLPLFPKYFYLKNYHFDLDE